MPYEVYEGADGLDRVRDAWQDLESRSSLGPFQGYSFCRLWYDTVGISSGAIPLVVVLADADAPAAIFPACVVRYGPARLLTWLAGPSVVGAGDVIVGRDATGISIDEFIATALSLLRRRARAALLYLTNVRGDAACYDFLAAHERVYKRSTAPYLPIAGDFEQLLAALDRDVRRPIERRWRRLNEAGSVRFEVLEGAEDGCRESAELLVEMIKKRHDKPGQRTDLFDDAGAAFRVEQALREPDVRLARLTLDGTTVALQLYYTTGSRIELAICGFDDEFARFAPGKLLMRCMVRECFDRGATVLDMGEGAEPYKYEWGSLDEPLTTFTTDDIRGRLLCSIAGSRRRAVRALAR